MSEAYMGTVERLEPEIAPIDVSAGAASIAVSLKRIADEMPTLRDHFAGQAMQADITASGSHEDAARALAEAADEEGITIEQRIAWNAYQVADAMMAERAKVRP